MIDVVVPDLGDFADVDVIDVLVAPGDTVAVDTPLITLETDKATMDVPSSAAGRISELRVAKGDKVSKGTVIAILEAVHEEKPAPAAASPPPQDAESGATDREQAHAANAPPPRSAASEGPTSAEDANYDFELVVLGAGPGGYTAAFRAADLGMKVALIERWPTLGGVCLNVGCIPSKALLHAARVIEDAASMAAHGISFGEPQIDADRLCAWKDKVVGRLTGGLAGLARQRKVETVRGYGRFAGPHAIDVFEPPEASSGPWTADAQSGRVARRITFAKCIIAAGSESVRLPGLPDDPRIIDSTGALELDLPRRLLVVGGGIIGLEMACVYDALGVEVSVVELLDHLMPGADRDLVAPLEKRVRKRYRSILLGTKLAGIEALDEGLRVRFEGSEPPEPAVYDKVLIAVGRSPNGKRIGAEAAGVAVTERGFIEVDRQMRTNVPHIFAIGDVVGQPMLAHKATHEGKLAAEVAHGEKRAWDARVIPSVAYTDPEVAWVGLTEGQAQAQGIAYEKASFPWAASGRSLAIGRDEGFTKLLFDPGTHRVIGGGIVGTNAGDLISEVALAIEMGSDASDLGLTIHPHPTLSETVAMAAEAFEGTLTDLYLPRRRA
jgi:dihydrolipoamide dehydrogenase